MKTARNQRLSGALMKKMHTKGWSTKQLIASKNSNKKLPEVSTRFFVSPSSHCYTYSLQVRKIFNGYHQRVNIHQMSRYESQR